MNYFELLCVFLILLLPFLYETNHIFRYYFKFVVYGLVVSFNSILLIPYFATRPRSVLNLVTASSFCHHVSTVLGLKWVLRGKEHLEKERACIIVANHQSSLDVLGMFDIWPVMNKCTVVAKKEIFYAWPFGLAAWLAGLIFIDRVRSEKARNTLNSVNRVVKAEKIKVWVFPEGTRRNTGEIHEFKKGAFHMAIDAQIPVLPIVFSSYSTFLNDKMRILNAGQIIITTLPPIPTKGLTKDDVAILIEKTHNQMSAVYKETSAEVLNKFSLHQKTTETLKSYTFKTIPNTTSSETFSAYNNFKDTVIAQ